MNYKNVLFFFIFFNNQSLDCQNQFSISLKLDPKSVVDETYITIQDGQGNLIVPNAILKKDTPLKINVDNRGPFHITYLSFHGKEPIHTHWKSGLGVIKIFPGKKARKATLCIDDEKEERCPKIMITRHPEWPHISLTEE